MYQQEFGKKNKKGCNMKKVCLLILIVLSQHIFSQNDESNQVAIFMDSAKYCLKNGEYEQSLNFFIISFSYKAPENPDRLYEAAVMAARTDNRDLSFMLLNLSVNKGFNRYEHILDNKDFIKFKDIRLKDCVDKIKTMDSILNIISYQLDTVFSNDQDVRNRYFSISNEDSINKALVIKEMERIDSNNLGLVQRMINEYGFWGKSLRTYMSRNAMWTILQHSSVLEEYLNILKKAKERGEIDAIQFAFSEDRVLLEKFGYQKYGTQYQIIDNKVIFPNLQDTVNVDLFRKEIGLETLNDYRKEIEISIKK